jgi:hypothetical protein
MERLTNGEIDWDDATSKIKIMLMKKGTSASLSGDSDSFLDDVPLPKRTGLHNGGGDVAPLLITKATVTTGPGEVLLKDSETSRSFVTVSQDSIEGYIVFKSSTATEGECPILCYNQLTNVPLPSSDGTDFKVTHATNGILKLSG